MMKKGTWITIFGVVAGVAGSCWLAKAYQRAREICPPFSKRSYTDVQQFVADLRSIWLAPQDLTSLRNNARITHPLLEKIMLAISGANGCRFRSAAQTRYAAQQGLSSTEISSLLRGEISYATSDEAPALVFAQHYAEKQGHPDEDMLGRLEDIYGSEMARDLLVYMRLVTFASLVGNTVDALWSRILGCPSAESNLHSELAVVALALFGAAPLTPVLVLRSIISEASREIRPA
jgi:hypothetical protein